MLRFWRNHSLSVVSVVLGTTLTAAACVFFESGKGFDVVSGIGIAFLTVAAFNLLAGPLVEKNRPEKDR